VNDRSGPLKAEWQDQVPAFCGPLLGAHSPGGSSICHEVDSAATAAAISAKEKKR